MLFAKGTTCPGLSVHAELNCLELRSKFGLSTTDWANFVNSLHWKCDGGGLVSFTEIAFLVETFRQSRRAA